MGPTGCHHHMVDQGRQILEEALERRQQDQWHRRQRCSARRLARGAPEGLGISADEDQLGAFNACLVSRFEPDSRAAADYDDGLAEEPGSRWMGMLVDAVLMVPPIRLSAFRASDERAGLVG